jgi:mono/diheme cytochrome c family protein
MLSRRVPLVAAALVALAAVAQPARAADYATVFTRSCAPCHGKDGEPSPLFAKQGVRNFKDAAWQKTMTDAQIEQTIREGKKGTMMASFDKGLSAAEIKGLVGYIRKLGGAKK